jgi:hypothetical protein
MGVFSQIAVDREKENSFPKFRKIHPETSLTKRRNTNDNWRITTRKLRKWGLISLQECRPKERFIGSVFKSGERPVRLPAMGNPRGVAQYVNGVC